MATQEKHKGIVEQILIAKEGMDYLDDLSLVFYDPILLKDHIQYHQILINLEEGFVTCYNKDLTKDPEDEDDLVEVKVFKINVTLEEA